MRPIVTAGLLLGIGLGGFVDGILLHQLLQVHSMLSAVRPKLTLVDAEVNMFWDGLFHAFTWVATCAGVYALWRAGAEPRGSWSGRALAGGITLGWGLFNVVEGVIDHHILGIHHVIERFGLSVFDWAFLAFGAALILGGWAMVRSAQEGDAPAGSSAV